MLISVLTNAQSIDSLFINMPDIINPVLNKSNRKMMLSGYKLNKNDSCLNAFMRYSFMLKYDSLENHILVRNTPVSWFEMKKFKLNGIENEIIGVIRTVGDSLKSSNITFYNTDWTLSQLKFNSPEAAEWLKNGLLNTSPIDKLWAANQLQTSFIDLKFSDKGSSIEARNNTFFYLSDETKKTLKPFLSERNIIFDFKNGIWIKAE